MRVRDFMRTVLDHYKRHGRHALPWRESTDPYRILVSEIMLQQTQVDRVIPKYRMFLRMFPSFRALAHAKPSDVLRAWAGLGYNRRALMLHRLAGTVLRDHGGRLPTHHSQLITLPGIGPYTAGAVMAFAFDKPHAIIETNIRRVYLHHFFPHRRTVSDSAILPLITFHLSLITSPRTWYGALMDYGSFLGERSKKSEVRMTNANRRSAQYTKQSRFEGSVRQLRGRILKTLLASGPLTQAKLAAAVADARVSFVIVAMAREGFVHTSAGKWHIL